MPTPKKDSGYHYRAGCPALLLLDCNHSPAGLCLNSVPAGNL